METIGFTLHGTAGKRRRCAESRPRTLAGRSTSQRKRKSSCECRRYCRMILFRMLIPDRHSINALPVRRTKRAGRDRGIDRIVSACCPIQRVTLDSRPPAPTGAKARHPKTGVGNEKGERLVRRENHADPARLSGCCKTTAAFPSGWSDAPQVYSGLSERKTRIDCAMPVHAATGRKRYCISVRPGVITCVRPNLYKFFCTSRKVSDTASRHNSYFLL